MPEARGAKVAFTNRITFPDFDRSEVTSMDTSERISNESMISIIRDIIDETMIEDKCHPGAIQAHISFAEDRKTWVCRRHPQRASVRRENCMLERLEAACSTKGIYGLGSIENLRTRSKRASATKGLPTDDVLCEYESVRRTFSFKSVVRALKMRRRPSRENFTMDSVCSDTPTIIKLKD